ncbi:MAG: T9SS type A sorting domain-containing protein [Bacteroidota bacterium]|nr:T9SS type A sorting domain-containing protein [Bacteroidota bacterium]MDP4196291.1 T9SS type A sorting domain-containing protein [Bacteroidota bacterium]
MKRLFILLQLSTFILSLFIPNNKIVAQWVHLNGPEGATVNSLVVRGNIIYAGTYGGVYQSINGGFFWDEKNNGLPKGVSILSLGVKDTVIFAGSLGKGIFRSTNFGSSWDSVNNGLPTRHDWINSLVIIGDTIYAGIYTGNYGLVYFSSDNGSSWNSISNGLPEFGFMNALAAGNNRLYAATSYGIYLLSPDSSKWTPVNNGIEDKYFQSIFAKGDTLYAGTSYGGKGIYRSLDRGNSWKLLETGLKETFVYSLAIKGSTIIAATSEYGIVLSTDNGQSWNPSNKGLLDLSIRTLAVKGDIILAGTSGSGAFISTDNGSSWKSSSKGFTNSSVNAMLLRGDTLFAALKTGVFFSTDNGDSWLSSNNGLDSTSVVSFAFLGNKIFALTKRGIYISSNNGSSWAAYNNGLQASIYNCIAAKGNYIFTGTDNGIYISTEKDSIWKSANKGMRTQLDSILSVSALTYYGNMVFAGASGITTGGGIFLSTDYGANWINGDEKIGMGTKIHIRSFAVAKEKIFTAYTYGQLYHPVVALTSDSGKSWTDISKGIPPYTETQKFHVIADSLYAITDYGTFSFSFDSLAWINAGQDFPGELLSSAYNNKYAFAGINGLGIWRKTLKATSIEIKDNSTKDLSIFALGQNYPNPFNSSTFITYSIPSYTNVELKLFDILGREILTLINQWQEKGKYKILFDASFLSSGVYIYVLKAGSFRESKKLILLR